METVQRENHNNVTYKINQSQGPPSAVACVLLNKKTLLDSEFSFRDLDHKQGRGSRPLRSSTVRIDVWFILEVQQQVVILLSILLVLWGI